MTWEEYYASQDMPEDCPVCGKPASNGPKLMPFCSTAHRDKYVRDQARRDAQEFLTHCAQPGELAEEDGVVCVLKNLYNQEDGRGFGEKFTVKTVARAVCGREFKYPKPTLKKLTCFGCLAEGAKGEPTRDPFTVLLSRHTERTT